MKRLPQLSAFLVLGCSSHPLALVAFACSGTPLLVALFFFSVFCGAAEGVLLPGGFPARPLRGCWVPLRGHEGPRAHCREQSSGPGNEQVGNYPVRIASTVLNRWGTILCKAQVPHCIEQVAHCTVQSTGALLKRWSAIQCIAQVLH